MVILVKANAHEVRSSSRWTIESHVWLCDTCHPQVCNHPFYLCSINAVFCLASSELLSVIGPLTRRRATSTWRPFMVTIRKRKILSGTRLLVLDCFTLTPSQRTDCYFSHRPLPSFLYCSTETVSNALYVRPGSSSNAPLQIMCVYHVVDHNTF